MLGKVLHDEHSELVDWKIADSRRVIKLPYSLVFYEGVRYVCMPLKSREDVENFRLEDFKSMNIDPYSLRYRGTKMFNKASSYDVKMLYENMGVEF